jgi:pyruvate ferredoxin oxidoreductase gamma subunit
VSFCRIDTKPIRLREPIVEPDALIVQDPTLLHQVDLFSGIGADAYVLVNTSRSLEALGLGELAERLQTGRLVIVPASELAREHVGRPLPNAALLGAFAGVTDEVGINSVVAAVRRRFSGETGEQNVAAARAAFDAVCPRRQEVARA